MLLSIIYFLFHDSFVKEEIKLLRTLYQKGCFGKKHMEKLVGSFWIFIFSFSVWCQRLM